MAKSDKRPPQRPKTRAKRKKPSPSGHTLDPGQRQAATKSDYFSKQFAEMPKMPKPILPFLIRPRPKPGLSPLPYPRNRK